MKRITLTAFCIAAFFISTAQPTLLWHFGSTGSSNATINQILPLSNGDMLIIGSNDGGDIDPGPTLDTTGWNFIARYSVTGQKVYSRPVSYTNNANIGSVYNIAVDEIDNYYLLISSPGGQYDFDTTSGSGEFNVSIGTYMIVKFDSSGNYLWCRIYPYNSDASFGNCLTTADGKVFLAGQLNNVVFDADPGPGNYIINATNKFNGVIVELDTSGNFTRACQIESTTGYYPNHNSLISLSRDNNGNIFGVGYYNGAIDLDPGAGTFPLNLTVVNAPYPFYLVSLDSAFNFRYGYSLSENGDYHVMNDSDNNLYLYGKNDYYGSVDMDPGPGIDSVPIHSSYISKFDPVGNYLWTKYIEFKHSYYGWWGTLEHDPSSFSGMIALYDTIVQNNMGLPTINFGYYLFRLDTSGTISQLIEMTNPGYIMNFRSRYLDDGHLAFTGRVTIPIDIDLSPGIVIDSSVLGDPWNEFFLSYYSFDATANRIDGKAFLDFNMNTIQDSLDDGLRNSIVQIQPGNYFLSTDQNGKYSAYVPSGNYSINVISQSKCFNVSLPLNHSANFPGTNQIDTANNFSFVPTSSAEDASVFINGVGNARPGFAYQYHVAYTNFGCDVLTGIVSVDLHPNLTYTTATPLPDLINGQHLEWNYADLTPLEWKGINLDVNISNATTNGDTLISVAGITPYLTDIYTLDNIDSALQVVTGSFDPNSKTVDPTGEIFIDNISAGIYLDYTINFQNTGTDTAFQIVIMDTISELLDLSTLQLISSSHPYTFQLYNSRLMEFTFQNILLPDSNVDEPSSHGFIRYHIKPLTTLMGGDNILNQAWIYFDFNDPVSTNITSNEVIDPLTVLSINKTDVKCFPNPFDRFLNIKTDNRFSHSPFMITDITGRIILTDELKDGMFLWDSENVESGIYFLSIEGASESKIKLVKYD